MKKYENISFSILEKIQALNFIGAKQAKNISILELEHLANLNKP